jgi:hypothetical protein
VPASKQRTQHQAIILLFAVRAVRATGNSEGDLSMLWLAQKSGYRALSLLVRHGDAQLNTSMTAGSEKPLNMAAEHGGVVFSMRTIGRPFF